MKKQTRSFARLLGIALCLLLLAGCAPVGAGRGLTPAPGATRPAGTPPASQIPAVTAVSGTLAPPPAAVATAAPPVSPARLTAAAPATAAPGAIGPIPPNAPTPVGTPGAAFTPGAPGSRFMAFGGPEGTHYLPTTDGETVVWTDGLDRIRAAHLSDAVEYPVVAQAAGLPDLSVAGPIVAWRVPEINPSCPPECRGHLEAKNIVTGAAVPLTETENAWSPSVSRNWLVWWRGDYGPGPDGPQVITRTLMALDLRTMAAPAALYQTDRQVDLVLDGNRAAWVEGPPATAGPTDQGVSTLRTIDLDTRQMSVLAEGNDVGFGGFDLTGDVLVYPNRGQNTFSAVNLRTGWRMDFPHASEPTTDGRYIFWIDYSQSPSLKLRVDLWGFDTTTGVQIPVAVEAGVNDYPVARGGAVVWLHHDGTVYGATHVYALRMAR